MKLDGDVWIKESFLNFFLAAVLVYLVDPQPKPEPKVVVEAKLQSDSIPPEVQSALSNMAIPQRVAPAVGGKQPLYEVVASTPAPVTATAVDVVLAQPDAPASPAAPAPPSSHVSAPVPAVEAASVAALPKQPASFQIDVADDEDAEPVRIVVGLFGCMTEWSWM